MTPRYFRLALRSFCRRRPFRPFLIEFVTGERLRIGHPEVVRMDGDVAIYTIGPGGILYRVFDGSSVCQLLDISPADSSS